MKRKNTWLNTCVGQKKVVTLQKKLPSMKKILMILTVATIAIGTAYCKSKNDEVVKLPSKIVSLKATSFVSELFYDEQNRLVKIISKQWEKPDTISIIYNIDGLPIRVDGMFEQSMDIVYENNGRKAILYDDVLWLNRGGRLVKYSMADAITWKFRYNSNGNITKWRESNHGLTIKYTNDVRPVFRHVNTPEWFLFWLSTNNIIIPSEKKGFLRSRAESSRYSYELDENSYVTKMRVKEAYEEEYESEYKFVFEFEYILANTTL